MSRITFRRADESDAFNLMKSYQLWAVSIWQDPLMLDYRDLSASMTRDTELWLVAERDGSITAFASLLYDNEQRMCKIQRMHSDGEAEERENLEKSLLSNVITETSGKADIVYTTSRCLSARHMTLTEEAGFHVLGFFPITGAAGELSCLTAFFHAGVLEELRYLSFQLHPKVAPFYEIVRSRLQLPPLVLAEKVILPRSVYEEMPPLEMITASGYVARKFRRLGDRRLLSNNFYPFQEPNTLICDPDEKVLIFAGIYPENRFATIIEERLELAVDPALLYRNVAMMIQGKHISYLEVIVDAADVAALELLIRAAFLPFAYFPCLKRHGDTRRDFVIMGRSFESLDISDRTLAKSLKPYIAEYFNLEMAQLQKRGASQG
ncbi:MAG: hypothetical protein AB9903_29975 [Vulcanimicrobiota bacterium]